MANFNKYQLEYIRENAHQIDEVKSLFEEKKNALKDLESQRSKPYNKNEPSLTPKDDIYFPKTHKTKGLDDETFMKEYYRVTDTYDQKIFDTTKENFARKGPEGDAKMVEDLGKEDFTLLMEGNGVEKVLHLHKERKSLNKKSLNVEMDEIEQKEISNNQEIERNIQMSEEKSHEIFNDVDIAQRDFKDSMKDMDVDKKPAPSEDFE